MPVFQPAEETGAGAQAMIDDGLFKRFPKPNAILGQHVMVGSSGVNQHPLGRDHLCRRQPANPNVRSRSSRLDASVEH